jgi:hypothetical protein
MTWTVHHGDALEVLRGLPTGSVHAVIQDPPGGADFLRLAWDGDRGGRRQWVAWLAAIEAEALRVALPGAHAATWAMPGTHDWTMEALDRAGWQRVAVCIHPHGQGTHHGNVDVAKAVESLVLFGSAANALWHRLRGPRRGRASIGRAGLNALTGFRRNVPRQHGAFDLDPETEEGARWIGHGTKLMENFDFWIVSRAPLAEATIAAQVLATGTGAMRFEDCRAANAGKWPSTILPPFPKASAAEKEAGLDDLAPVLVPRCNPGGLERDPNWAPRERRNTHPTAKPIALMRYLARLLCPAAGTVLDPFAGSGTTGIAAALEGLNFIGIELNDRHHAEAEARLRFWIAWGDRPPPGLTRDGAQGRATTAELDGQRTLFDLAEDMEPAANRAGA